MQTTSFTLLQRLRRPGDEAAWRSFVQLYTPLLYYWARRAGLQEDDAADLVQDVFALLLKKLPEFSYNPDKSFRGWLKTVALNKFRENHRKRTPAAGPLPDVAVADPDSLWDTEYRQQLIHRALELMKNEFQPTTWRACWEFVVGGKSAAQVASELSISVGAVRAAKFRVLCRLRQELAGLLE
jgi:RNA polymerase sigma-70 factor (ECF subfamily)